MLAARFAHHPAILVVGPRACGKSTTCGAVANNVIRLDQPAEAAAVRADPDAALRGRHEPILLDEWQTVPEVLGAVKRAVDVSPTPGRFLITGSVRGEIEASTWPGTGRLVRVPMYGLSMRELQGHATAQPLLDAIAEGNLDRLTLVPSETADLRTYAEWILRGSLPEPALRLPSGERSVWMASYLDDLLTRDAANLNARPDPERLKRFAEACALHSGGVVDRHSIQRDAGVAKGTAESYEELLRALVLLDQLPAWWSNRLKRLARSPKRHFVDPALALSSLRVDIDGLLRDGDLL